MQFRMNKMHIKVLAVLKDVKTSFKIHCKHTAANLLLISKLHTIDSFFLDDPQ